MDGMNVTNAVSVELARSMAESKRASFAALDNKAQQLLNAAAVVMALFSVVLFERIDIMHLDWTALSHTDILGMLLVVAFTILSLSATVAQWLAGVDDVPMSADWDNMMKWRQFETEDELALNLMSSYLAVATDHRRFLRRKAALVRVAQTLFVAQTLLMAAIALT